MLEKHTNEHGEEIYGYLLNSKLMAAAYHDNRLQNETKSFLGLLISYAYPNGSIKHFSIKDTAKRKSVKRWAIQNQIKKLIEYAYIKKLDANSYGHRNQYQLLYNNFEWYEGVIQLGNTRGVTPLGYTGVTQYDDTDVTPSDYPKKTLENKEVKKEKEAHPRDMFLDRIKKEIGNHIFQEIGNLSEDIIIEQAKACWDTWDAKGQFPEGNQISAFKGWLRYGLRDKKIKSSPSTSPSENAAQNTHIKEPDNPIQDWHHQIRPIVGEAVFKSWIRSLHWDGNGTIQAPTKFTADRVKQDYQKQINEVLPNAQIIFKPYKTPPNQKEEAINGSS